MATDITITTDIWEEDEECVITGWLVDDGATVDEGALVVEIMTAKVQYEVHAAAAGTVKITEEADAVVAKGAGAIEKGASMLGIFPLVFGGDYLAMAIGVLLFHWQHVYDPGYVRPAETWRIKEASKEETTQRLKEANEELQWQEFRQLNLRVAELNGRVAELEAARSGGGWFRRRRVLDS